MICSTCSANCTLPNENINRTNTRNIAIIINGIVKCIPCNDISDLLCDSIDLDKPVKIVKNEIVKPTKNNISMNCPKCKKKFTEKNCACGFKNPLFR
jgi:hypothetical protein